MGVAVVGLVGATLFVPNPIATGAACVFAIGAVLLLGKLADLEARARPVGARVHATGQPHALTGEAERQIANAQREAQIHPVTGASTREPLAERIGADIAAGTGERLLGAIRLTDYDRLADFDLHAANAALARFARRLIAAAKADIAFGQIDRDTFALWFQDETEHRPAAAEFQALLYVARQDLEAGDDLISPKVEAAAVRYPADGDDAAHLFVRVTAALNIADRRGASRGPIAAPEPADAARRRFMLEQDLNRAIDDRQLRMMFQPVVDVSQGRLLGAEALLRWDHPTLGPVPPATFIPVVEGSGLADRFGMFVLNAACREARLWRDAGRLDLKMAVNLSARQLNDPGLRDKIERTLARHDLGPAALELELTETAAMQEADRTHALFSALRQSGMSLAIDDFGSGYSSLSYLRNLPFDKLKIDREFVSDIDSRRDSRAICRALIELGRGLGLVVLAEGVETAAEVETLRGLGCHVFQGYYFSQPLSGDDFRRHAADATWPASLATPTLVAFQEF